MKIAPKNWNEFQHYKNRNPVWIKLHKRLLDDFEFQCLPVASKALAPMLWLLASESKNGVIDADPEKLAFRLRMTPQDIEEALAPLIGKGFFEVVQFASNTLAAGKPDAMPEKRREEKETTSSAAPTAPCSPQWSPGFLEFWRAWPKSDRKADKAKCFEHWRRKNLDSITGDICHHVGLMRTSRKWREGYEPAPLRYLRGECWHDPVPAAETSGVAY